MNISRFIFYMYMYPPYIQYSCSGVKILVCCTSVAPLFVQHLVITLMTSPSLMHR